MGPTLAERFSRDGFVGPLRALAQHEALEFASVLRNAMKEEGYSARARRNRHLDLPGGREVATAPAILECLAQVYSPNLALWRSHAFTGSPGRGLGWHSDRFSTLLADALDHATVHLALTRAPLGNCMMVIPESHSWPEEERARNGFRLIEKTAQGGYGTPYYQRTNTDRSPHAIPLEPGEFFVFHPATLHASVDRIGDASNSNPLLGFAKRSAKAALMALASRDLAPDPPRIALGLRFCDPRNTVSREAFAEMPDRGTAPVVVAGDADARDMIDWRS